MKRIAMRSFTIWILVLLLVGGLCFFLVEYVSNSKDWVMSEGSPHVYNGGNLGNGIVVDRDGVLLLDTTGNRTYSATKELRQAMIHWLGDRKGCISAPAVAHYAEEMAGYDLMSGLYSETGGRATLTLSSHLQLAAQQALGTNKGVVALYNYKTGELLCSVTGPNYDPDDAPDLDSDLTGQYEGVYMNRFTQSVYVPGSIFKIVTTAAALEEIEDIRDQTFECTGVVEYGEYDVTCEHVHGKLDFYSAMAQSCNCAYAQIVKQLGGSKLQKYVEKYGVTESVTFDGVTTAKGNFDITDSAKVQVAWSGIGQHKDQVNPCRFLTFVGAIANDGVEITPYLMQTVTSNDHITYKAKAQEGKRIMSAEVARELQKMMRNNVEEKYGVEEFPDMNVCAKSGTAQVGGEKKSNAMFTGFVTDEQYPIAFFVAVEDAGYGRKVCVPIISQVLEACMEIM